MTEIHCPPLERGTALTQLWEAAEGMRLAQQDLVRGAEEHALVVLTFVRDVADGDDPDPADLLRSRGQVEALVQRVHDHLCAGGDALAELRFGLLPHPEADPALEARAMEHLRERFRRRAGAADGPRPEDPRTRASEQDV